MELLVVGISGMELVHLCLELLCPFVMELLVLLLVCVCVCACVRVRYWLRSHAFSQEALSVLLTFVPTSIAFHSFPSSTVTCVGGMDGTLLVILGRFSWQKIRYGPMGVLGAIACN